MQSREAIERIREMRARDPAAFEKKLEEDRKKSFENKLQTLCDSIENNTIGSVLDVAHHLDLRVYLSTKQIVKLANAFRKNTSIKTFSMTCNRNFDTAAGLALVKALEDNKTLTSLDLSSNRFGSEIGILIAKTLSLNKTLTSINLFDNYLGTKAGLAFAEALKVNTTLKSMKLTNNNLDTQAGRALAEALEVNKTLTNLDLSINSLDGCAFARALICNNTLRELNLSYNNLGAVAGVELGFALTKNHTLQVLDLSNTGLACAVYTFARALKTNRVLRALNLESNGIEDEEGCELARALKVNDSLRSINLRHNGLKDKAGIAFAEALEINTTLTEVNLGVNRLTSETGIRMAKALNTNNTLSKLALEHNVLGLDACLAITKVFEVNKTLTSITVLGNHLEDQESSIFDIFKKLTHRNKLIHCLVKDIRNLFSDTPKTEALELDEIQQDLAAEKSLEEWLKEYYASREGKSNAQSDKHKRTEMTQPLELKEKTETLELQEMSEEFDFANYDDIRKRIRKLESESCPPIFIQELRDLAKLAFSSWDNYLAPEIRIEAMLDIMNRNSHLKREIMKRLAPIYLTQGMLHFTKERELAEKYFMLAYTTSWQGWDDDTHCQSISLLFDDKKTETDRQLLLSELAKKHPDRFQKLMSGYLNQCKVFDLKPHPYNPYSYSFGLYFMGSEIPTKISEAAAKPLVLSKDSQGDCKSQGDTKSQADAPCGECKSSAEATSQLSEQRIEKQSTDKSRESIKPSDLLSLDEEEADVDAESETVQLAIAASLKSQV